MKQNRKTIRIVLLILIILILTVGIFALVNQPSLIQSNSNQTDLEALKQSEYTSQSFDEVQLGTSLEAVEQIMGALTEEPEVGEFKVYSLPEDEIIYYFYFNDNSLENVSIFLNS